MKIKTIIRLRIGAQSAIMGPPLGPTLGQFGVSAVEFIKKFNDMSSNYIKGTILSTIVYVYIDRTYKINIIGPIVSSLLKNVYKIKKFGPGLKKFSNTNLIATNYILYEIYYFLNSYNLLVNNDYNIIKSLKGLIKSFGVLYVFDKKYTLEIN
jgi:large subunit ribosomal protein L11